LDDGDVVYGTGTTQTLELMEYLGAPLVILPGVYNRMVSVIQRTNETTDIDNTLDIDQAYVTPRWTLL
jgi:hypothetical protein